MLGIHLIKNFEQPYLSTSITEFWRRWHISLSSWLRDYMYISLGGNRKGLLRTYFNLMATMLIGGLWHGASWTFVVWGGLHGMYLAIHKWLISRSMGGTLEPVRRMSPGGILKMVGTFHLVTISWIFFPCTSFTQAWDYLTGIATR